MSEHDATGVRQRQDPLRKRYQVAPAEASITDRARTTGGVDSDPFHGRVRAGSKDHGSAWPFGIHPAVGGFGDAPNPGDVLCAALAACLDSTLRMIAERLGIALTSLEVEVTAEVDVRGTLLVDKDVPVGFQAMTCRVDVQAVPGTDPRLLKKLIAASENSCVVLQTLRSGVSVETRVNAA